MKQMLMMIICFFLMSMTVVGQNTNPAFQWQGVIRDDVGNVYKERAIKLQFSIINGTTNTAEYVEQHTNVLTNKYGLVNLKIGRGDIINTGTTLSAINWSSDQYFIKIELDTLDGSNIPNYIDMGAPKELLYNPIVLSANFAKAVDLIFQLNGNNLEIIDGSGTTKIVDISGFKSNVTLFTLTSNQMLDFVIDGNQYTADLSTLALDNSANNELITSISINGNDELMIAEGSNIKTINLQSYKNNGVINLSLNNNILKLETDNGNYTIDLSGFANVVNSFALNGQSLDFIYDNIPYSADLTPLLTDTDANNELITSISINSNNELEIIENSNTKTVSLDDFLINSVTFDNTTNDLEIKQGPTIHTVNIPLPDLTDANNIVAKDELTVGEEITIPTADANYSPTTSEQGFVPVNTSVKQEIKMLNSGILKELTLNIDASAGFTLNIYGGDLTNTNSIHSQLFTGSFTGQSILTLSNSISVNAAQIYTIEIVASQSFVVIGFNNGNNYLDGACDLTGANVTTDPDLVFETTVDVISKPSMQVDDTEIIINRPLKIEVPYYYNSGTNNPYPFSIFNNRNENLFIVDERGFVDIGGSDFRLGRFDGRFQGSKLSNRALVHGGSNDILFLNYGYDFEGGVIIGSPTTIEKSLTISGDANISGFTTIGLNNYWDTDFAYFGLKDEGTNRKDAIIKWGDDLNDKFKFIHYEWDGTIGVESLILTLNSDGNATLEGNLTQSSDLRYKTNITAIPNSLEKLLNLNGVYYDWKREEFPNKAFSEEKQIGVIAQEVEKLFPELVHTDEDGYKSVAYSKLTPILIEAIKEQQAQIEDLKAQLKKYDEIANQVEALTQQMEALKSKTETSSK